MRVALFGGTFNPVHSGHLSAAAAAQEAFRLDRILFVPAAFPPHKRDRKITPFVHRYAMVALACSGNAHFIPSLLEMETNGAGEPNYSIRTVRRLASELSADHHLYFLLGADAFLELPQWHEPTALLDSCDFIVVSRPGFPVSQLESVIPPELAPRVVSENTVALRKTCLYLLTSVHAEISSSTIRQLAARRQPLRTMVPDSVEEYIIS